MYKFDRKLKGILVGSILLVGLFLPIQAADAMVSTTYANGKKVIDGGVTYPVIKGATGPYRVNTQKVTFKHGRTATPNEIQAWDIDVMPDGTGLPEGKGSVEEGDELYEAKCASCHADFGAGADGYPGLAAGNAEEGHAALTNQRTTPDKDGPIRVFGTYWPYASTLWWYIKTGMPHNAPMSLSNDEVYALVAYILSINEMKIDGEELDDESELDRAKFMKIVMPNKNGFIPDINGPKGTDAIRKLLNDSSYYGNGTRCMKGCKPGTKLVHIQTEINDFTPPMSIKRELPKTTEAAKADPGKAIYEKTCAMCHDTGAASAPIVKDKEAWATVMAQGMDTVYENALKGKGAMPPKGGNMNLKDDELKAVVDYMVNQSK
jgi:cytochrome c